MNNIELLIKFENDNLISGDKEVPVCLLDSHQEHILDHCNILCNPKYSSDPQIVERTMKHIQDHIDQLNQYTEILK